MGKDKNVVVKKRKVIGEGDVKAENTVVNERRSSDNLAPKSKPAKSKSSVGQGQYIGISLVVLAVIMAVMIVNYSGSDYFTENIIMTFAMGISIILTTLSYTTIAIVVGAASIVGFVGYKLYSVVLMYNEYAILSFLWIIVPVIAVIGMYLYVSSNSGLALENALLKKQIAELVMTDPLTGLYNLRSMFMDIQTQISYSERNETAISLMIIKLRYPEEMKKVLKSSEYETVIKQLALLLVDTVRLEDKVYSIDDNGGFGIILTCDKKGTEIVEGRLRKKLENPEWFQNVSQKHQIRTEVKIGYLQYDKNKYNRDASAFKADVEEEVDYDI